MSEEDVVGYDIDYILEHIVGGGGRWQWSVVAMMWPIGICAGFPLLLHMFAAFAPRYRCFIPGCDSNTTLNSVDTIYNSFALPSKETITDMFSDDDTFDSCNMYTSVDSGGSCLPSSFDTSTIVPCQSYVYDLSIFPETLTTKLDLVCGYGESKRRLLGSIMMAGLMIGSLVGGKLSDRFGRKRTILWSIIVVVPATMFGGYSPNYATYIALRLLSCTALPCIWVANHSLTMEAFGHTHRKKVIIVKDYFWPVTQMILTLVVYYVRHWTNMHIWVGVICCAAFPSLFVLPESPRWLASNKRKEEAEEIILQIGRWNGKHLTLMQREEIRTILTKIEKAGVHKQEKNLNPIHMFYKANIKKTVIVLFNWITVCVGSYTLILNATRLHGDLFLNFILAGVLGDVPGTIALTVTMKYFSRRFNLFYMQATLGLSCLVLAFMPKEYPNGVLFFYLLGKCSSGAAFLLVWVITAELFPTNLRSQAVGFCSTVARVFGLVSPFVAKLAMYWKPLPMLLLGLPSLISAGLVYFIPETADRELPQHMTDAVKLAYNQSPDGNEEELKELNKTESKQQHQE